jgi:hypothetical protein
MQVITPRDSVTGTTLSDSADSFDHNGVTMVNKGDREPDEESQGTEHRGDGASEGQNDGSKEEKEAEESSGQRP